MQSLNIGKRRVGYGEPCFIVAEAGSNHNGSLEQALRLIDVAAESNADAVKFQTFRADAIYPKNAGSTDYLNIPRSIYEIIRDMQMPYEWIPELASYCKEKGVIFMSTPFDERSADVLEEHVDVYKIASYELTHLPLIQYIGQKGKPVIISTGAASMEEVRETVYRFLSTGNEQLVLLQCTAKYPAPLDALNLRTIPRLMAEFDVPVGLSDHSRDPYLAPVMAIAFGASVLEKHFTLSNRLPGPDHAFGVEPQELLRMVQRVRDAERCLGTGVKEPLEIERELRAFGRRTVFTTRDVRKGEFLSRENLAVLRCGKKGYGLPPKMFHQALGKAATRDIPCETPISSCDYYNEAAPPSAESDVELSSRIKAYWDERASRHAASYLAGSPDAIVKDLEIKSVLKYILDGLEVVEVGCGNGLATVEFARQRAIRITGIDYSEAMIRNAQEMLKQADAGIQRRVRFETGDVKALPLPDAAFDLAITQRCLINLTSLDEQRKAITEIRRVLRPGGVYIMNENTSEGLARLNTLRRLAGLEEMRQPWHNMYVSEADLLPFVNTMFKVESEENYSSLYYVISRVFNAYLASLEGKQPDYYHPLNRLAIKLPSFGDFGQGKIFVLRKMENVA